MTWVRFAALAIFMLVFLHRSSAYSQVVNLGFPGANTKDLSVKLDEALALQPAFLVIMAGANDALNPAKLLPPGDSRRYIEQMLVRASTKNAQVILVTVHDPDMFRLLARHNPSDYGDTPPKIRLAAMNAVIRELAQQHHLPLADFHAALAAAGGANTALSTDGLHLTRQGYALLAATVRDKLPPHLPASRQIVCFGDSLTYGIGVRPPDNAPETAATYPAQLRALLAHDDR